MWKNWLKRTSCSKISSCYTDSVFHVIRPHLVYTSLTDYLCRVCMADVCACGLVSLLHVTLLTGGYSSLPLAFSFCFFPSLSFWSCPSEKQSERWRMSAQITCDLSRCPTALSLTLVEPGNFKKMYISTKEKLLLPNCAFGVNSVG